MKKIVKKTVSVAGKALKVGKKAVPALRTASTIVDVSTNLLKKVKTKKRKTKNNFKMKRIVRYKYRRGSAKNVVLKASAGFGLSEIASNFLGPGLISAGAGLVSSYYIAGKMGLVGSAIHTLLRSGLFNITGQQKSFRNP